MKKIILLVLVFKLYSGGCLSKQDKVQDRVLAFNSVAPDREGIIIEPLEEVDSSAVQLKSRDTTFNFLIELCKRVELPLLERAMSAVSIESDECKGQLLKNFIAYFFLKDVDTSAVLDLDLDVNSVDKNQNSILHYCVQNSLENLLKFVLSFSDLNLNLQNENGDTALRIAANMENFNLVKLLLSNEKVDPNIKNNWGYTPLHSAVSKNNIKIVRLLLANQSTNPNIQNSIGNTALHLACVRGHELAVKLLLDDNRVDTSITNFAGITPLCLADLQKNLNSLMKLIVGHKNYKFTLADLSCNSKDIRSYVNKIGCRELRYF